jgi:hypothetical protein
MTRNKAIFVKKHQKYFGRKCMAEIMIELKQLFFEPTVYDLVYMKYRLKGIVDFILGKKGKM